MLNLAQDQPLKVLDRECKNVLEFVAFMNKLLLSLVVLFFSTLDAAFPITHVQLTRMYFKQFPKYNQEEQKIFIIGTLFPDIRYFGKCERNETHYDAVSLKDVLEETNPFIAGMKFHSYVDIEREALVVKENIYAHLKNDPHFHTHLKAIEDEILSEQNEYSDISCLMGDILPEELDSGISEATIRKWHQALAFLFMASPSKALQVAALSGKGFIDLTPEEIQEWSKTLKKEAQEEAMQLWVKKLLFHFNELLQKEESALPKS